MAFKCTTKSVVRTDQQPLNLMQINFNSTKASISFLKVNLLNILRGICSLTYNIMPPPFPVQSIMNGTEYPGTQNRLIRNVLSIFVSGISNTSILFETKPKRKLAQTSF